MNMERLHQTSQDGIAIQPGDGDPGGNGLQEARDRANDLLQAGQDAIARALSGNSSEYLSSMRQEGGQ